MEKPNRKDLLAISLIFLLALFLNTYDIERGMGHDDVLNLEVISNDVPRIMGGGGVHPDQTPLYFVFMHFWAMLFGFTELSFRMASVLFGLLCIPAIYFLGSLLFNRRVGVASAFLLAISIYLIDNARLFSMYSLFLLLSILSTYFFFSHIKRNDLKSLVLFGIVSVINLYTHYFASFLLNIQILYYVVFYAIPQKRKSKGFFTAVGLIFITSLPVIIRMKEAFLFNVRDSIDYPCTMFSMLNSIHYNFVQWILFLVLASLFVAGLAAAYKKKRKLFVFSLMLSGIPLLTAFMLRCVLLFEVKHNLFILPVFIVIIASFLVEMPPKMRIAPFSLIVFLSSFALADYYSRPYDPDWKGAADYIGSNYREGDMVVLSDYASGPMSYYLERGVDIKDFDSLGDYSDSYDRIWFVYIVEDIEYTMDTRILQRLGSSYQQVDQRLLFSRPTLHDVGASNVTINLYKMK